MRATIRGKTTLIELSPLLSISKMYQLLQLTDQDMHRLQKAVKAVGGWSGDSVAFPHCQKSATLTIPVNILQ